MCADRVLPTPAHLYPRLQRGEAHTSPSLNPMSTGQKIYFLSDFHLGGQ